MIGWIIGAVVFGEMLGFMIAVAVSGKFDDYMEWRSKENEKKRLGNRGNHDADGDRRDGGGTGE